MLVVLEPLWYFDSNPLNIVTRTETEQSRCQMQQLTPGTASPAQMKSWKNFLTKLYINCRPTDLFFLPGHKLGESRSAGG